MPRPAEAETPVNDHHLVVSKVNQAFYSRSQCRSVIIHTWALIGADAVPAFPHLPVPSPLKYEANPSHPLCGKISCTFRMLWYPAEVLYIVGALQGVACGLLIHFCGK